MQPISTAENCSKKVLPNISWGKMGTKFHDLFHNAMWGDFDRKSCFPSQKPLLAHYTSLNTLESICKSNEIWFSNPLCMNDYEELRFVLSSGKDAFLKCKSLRAACKTKARHKLICSNFSSFFSNLENGYVLDTYAFVYHFIIKMMSMECFPCGEDMETMVVV